MARQITVHSPSISRSVSPTKDSPSPYEESMIKKSSQDVIKQQRSGDLRPPLKTLLKRKTLVGRNLILNCDQSRFLATQTPEDQRSSHSSSYRKKAAPPQTFEELCSQNSKLSSVAPSEEIKECE